MSKQHWLIALVLVINLVFFVMLDRRDVAAQGNGAGAVGRYQISACATVRGSDILKYCYMVDTATGQIWECNEQRNLEGTKWEKVTRLK